MPESFTREVPEGSNAPKVYGKRNPDSVIEERCKRLFKRQLTGLPARHLVLDHCEREGVSEATAWRDWNVVSQWNEDGWNEERETILPRIQAMRMRIIELATRKGQLQTAMMGLKDLQETLLSDTNGGESIVQLNINIENPKQ